MRWGHDDLPNYPDSGCMDLVLGVRGAGLRS